MITQFPERILSPKSTLFFSALCAAFSGDESLNLRERAGELIQLLVKKYPNDDYYKVLLRFIHTTESLDLILTKSEFLVDDKIHKKRRF